MEEFKISPQEDLKIAKLHHPNYKLTKILPYGKTQEMTITPGGGEEIEFHLPASRAYNLSQSILNFWLTPSVTAGAFRNIYIPGDNLPMIRQIQFQTSGGLFLCDLNDAANFTSIVFKSDIKMKDYIQFDSPINGTTSGITKSKLKASAVNQVVDPNYRSTDSAQAVSTIDMPFIEPLYFVRGVSNSITPSIHYTINLGVLKNTIFAVDKTMLFDEVMIIRLVFHGTDRFTFVAFDNVTTKPDPNNNAVQIPDPQNNLNGPTNDTDVYGDDVVLTNLALYLAVEKDVGIEHLLRKDKNEGKLKLLIPFVYSNKVASDVGPLSIQLKYNNTHGRNLMKIYHSCFNSDETMNTCFDHSNINGLKFTDYYTRLDGNRVQDFNISTATADLDDWKLHQDKLKKSVIMTSNIYQYNWFHCDDFTGCQPLCESNDNDEQGLDLSLQRVWDLTGSVVNNPCIQYTWAVVSKQVSVTPDGIILQ